MNKSPAVIAANPKARFAPYHFAAAAANTQNPVIRRMLYQACADLKAIEAMQNQPHTQAAGRKENE